MAKNRANNLIENGTFKFPVKLKFDLTGIFSQGDEIPLPRKMLKRAIYKDHINGFWAMVDIAGMEKLINTLEVNINFGI